MPTIRGIKFYYINCIRIIFLGDQARHFEAEIRIFCSPMRQTINPITMFQDNQRAVKRHRKQSRHHTADCFYTWQSVSESPYSVDQHTSFCLSTTSHPCTSLLARNAVSIGKQLQSFRKEFCLHLQCKSSPRKFLKNVFGQLRPSSRQPNPKNKENTFIQSVGDCLLVEFLRPHKICIFSNTTVRMLVYWRQFKFVNPSR